MKKNLAIVAGIIVATFAVLLFIDGQENHNSTGGEGVRIAVNLPLTGPQAAFSGEIPLGLRMGIEEAAAARGLDKSLFKVDAQDNQGLMKNGVRIMGADKLKGFDAYMSGLSTVSAAIAQEVDKNLEAPHFFIAFEASITRAAANRFRTMPSYKIEGPMYVKYAKHRKATRIFILAMNVASVDEQLRLFVEPQLAEAGIEFHRERYEIMTTDYRSLALKALAFKPDLILINGLSFNLIPMIQALRSQGLEIDGNVLTTMDMLDVIYAEDKLTGLEGIVSIAPTFEIPGRVPEADAWRERFTAYGGKVPNYVQAHAYDTGQMLVAAYERNQSITPDSIKSIFPFKGVVGEVGLDEHGDLITELGYIKLGADLSRKEVKVSP